MKKFYFLILCSIPGFLMAQITITSNDMPANGDTVRYSSSATTGLNPAAIVTGTGANFTWNYNTLVPTAQLLESFKSSLTTPYLAYFAGMIGYKRADSINLGPLTMKNVWDFYKNTSTMFSLEGTGFTLTNVPVPLASSYTDPDKLYYFPLNYGDVDSGTFYVNTSIPAIGSYVQSGKRKNTVDGWGSMTTPFGTFNVIRMRSVVTETDTVKATFGGFPITIPITNNRIELKWLANGVHIPILEIVITTGTGAPTISSVKYRDQYHYIPVTPGANFTADNVYPKINDVVKLSDLSSYIPTRWKWTITPATYTLANSTNDTLQNIFVKFTANGNYTVSLRAQNNAGQNTNTKNAYIKVSVAPVVKFGADKLNANIADLVTLTDSSLNAPTRWKWTILPSTYAFNAGSLDTLKSIGVMFNKGGFYAVDLKVTNPWGIDQATKINYVWINFPAGINNTSGSSFIIYPNPVRDELQFVLPNPDGAVITIYNSYGALVYSGNAVLNNTIDLKDFSNGIYIIELKSNTTSLKARFIKNN
jgi:PKD repeat protein